MNIRSHASADTENLTKCLKEELEALHPWSEDCCIYRVPKRLHCLNKKAYTPRIVSIGPFHHGKDEFKSMEEHKRRYLQTFLSQTSTSLGDFVKIIKEREERLRNCYSQTIELDSDDFTKMVLVDSAFIIQLLLRYSFHQFSESFSFIFNRWLIVDILHDLWLLENQLPFFILDELFEVAQIHVNSIRVSMIDLIYNFFQDSFITASLNRIFSYDVKHFVDLIRICLQPPRLDSGLRKQLKKLYIPSALELHDIGVKFKVGSSKNLFDIRFKKGVLEIPRMIISASTESILSNVVAYEQCHCVDIYMNDYVSLMEKLVSTSKDGELIVQKGIIDNDLGNVALVSTLFHNISTIIAHDNFYFSGLVEDLNDYCQVPWHKWKATLRRDYFRTPWATVSVIAAVILLALTFIQSMCSILALQ